MAMGIVSDKDFNLEKSKLEPREVSETIPSSAPSNPVTATVVDVSRGRPIGATEVPNSLRKLIGEESVTNGRQSALELGAMLGVSPSSVSAYTNGSTSTASYAEQPNLEHINGAKEKISKRARNKLMLALRHITSDKLEGTKARDLAGIARDMSAVVKNMEPEGPKVPVGNNGPTFVFYSPIMRKEDVFDVVVAKD